MFIVKNRVAGRGSLVFAGRQLLDVFTGRRIAGVMMMIAVRISDGMMSTGLVVLQLVVMILFQRRVEVLLLVCSRRLSVGTLHRINLRVPTPC